MHLKRWITSIVALPILGILIFKGGPLLFTMLIGAAALIAWWEYVHIVMVPAGRKASDPLILLGMVIAALIVWAAYCNSFEGILGLMSINLIATGVIAKIEFEHGRKTLEAIAKQLMGIVYVPGLLAFIVLLRNDDAGIAWIVLLICVVFAGDVGAYYVGSYLGRHKLCPNVSPKKTIEGALGGLTANLLIGVLVKLVYFQDMPWFLALMMFLCVGFVGQVGDLFASMMKRSAGIKDSGNLLPGHGGILDRIDALMFAAPVAYLFKDFLL